MDSTNINFIQDTSFVVSHGSATTKEAILFIYKYIYLSLDQEGETCIGQV